MFSFSSSLKRFTSAASSHPAKYPLLGVRYYQFLASRQQSMERPSKRAKPTNGLSEPGTAAPGNGRASLASLHRSISPPARSSPHESQAAAQNGDDTHGENKGREQATTKPRLLPSPFKLTHIRDLPDRRGLNHGAVKLSDILGDPMIKECWQFNYLFDVDFLMSQFDEDVRNLVKVKVVHGSWKREADNRIRIEVNLNLPFQTFHLTFTRKHLLAGLMLSLS